VNDAAVRFSWMKLFCCCWSHVNVSKWHDTAVRPTRKGAWPWIERQATINTDQTSHSSIGMYVNHEFTIAVITVIFALCRDFRQLPWFCVTAVIITKISTISISISKRSIFCKYIAYFFLGHVVASLTLLYCQEYIHTERWPHAQ